MDLLEWTYIQPLEQEVKVPDYDQKPGLDAKRTVYTDDRSVAMSTFYTNKETGKLDHVEYDFFSEGGIAAARKFR